MWALTPHTSPWAATSRMVQQGTKGTPTSLPSPGGEGTSPASCVPGMANNNCCFPFPHTCLHTLFCAGMSRDKPVCVACAAAWGSGIFFLVMMLCSFLLCCCSDTPGISSPDGHGSTWSCHDKGQGVGDDTSTGVACHTTHHRHPGPSHH